MGYLRSTAFPKHLGRAVLYELKICIAATCLIMAHCQCIAQSPIVHIVDIVSGEKIPYARLEMKERSLFADNHGKIIRELLEADSILVTSLGFNPVELSVQQVQDTIFLLPKVMELPEFSVSAINESYDLGFHDSKPARIGIRIPPNFFIGVKIDSEHYSILVEEAIINFRKIKRGVLFDIYIFDAISDTIAGDMLYKRRYETQNSKRLQRVPITNSEVVLGLNGGFICIVFPEVNSVDSNNNSMNHYFRATLDHDELKSFVFYKNHWSLYDRCFETETDCQTQNFMIGAKVRKSN